MTKKTKAQHGSKGRKLKTARCCNDEILSVVATSKWIMEGGRSHDEELLMVSSRPVKTATVEKKGHKMWVITLVNEFSWGRRMDPRKGKHYEKKQGPGACRRRANYENFQHGFFFLPSEKYCELRVMNIPVAGYETDILRASLPRRILTWWIRSLKWTQEPVLF